MTGTISDGQQLSEVQVETMLEDRGYENVSDVSRDGDKVKVDVSREYGVIVEERDREG